MRRTKILNASEVKRISYSEAQSSYFKHCRLKNLRAPTITYYKEDIEYFQAKTGVKYVADVTQEVFDDFILSEMDSGKKINSLNSRIRGLRVFFKFCAEREYMKPIATKLMKTDVEVKEPYTEAGMGGTGEAIYYGVPMIAIPQMDEQAITAGQIEKNGLGLAFPDKKTITADALRVAILRLLEEPSFRETARAFSEDMRSLGGAKASADAIVRFLRDRNESA